MKTISNKQLTIQVSLTEPNFAVSSPMEKNICGKPILLFGNATLLSYSQLSEAYGKMSIGMKGFPIRLLNMVLPVTWNL